MSGSVLVAYATRYGSTKEVAEKIAATLWENGLAVDVQPLHNVKSLEGFSAVVIGAPLQMFRWHKDAIGFLNRFRNELCKVPVAVFALGPFHDEESEWAEVRKQLDKELANFAWFSPVSVSIVGAKYDPSVLGFPFNVIPAMKQIPAIDIRNWDAVHGWAEQLVEKMESTSG